MHGFAVCISVLLKLPFYHSVLRLAIGQNTTQSSCYLDAFLQNRSNNGFVDLKDKRITMWHDCSRTRFARQK